MAPIGVFDSGLGGLTVARAIMRHLPNESLLYVGDTARVPYGPKSPDTVRRYARQIGEWLVDEGAKCVVVACNTATAHALPLLQATLPVPVLGVIEPGARAAARMTTQGVVGVIGTTGTIASNAYTRALHEVAPQLVVHGRACPLFVPLVEEGWTDHPATMLIVREYLAPLHALQVDTVVLGCTHYPLLRTAIAQALGPAVTLIDSADETARALGQLLDSHQRRAHNTDVPQHRFVASDAPQHFLALGRRFLDNALGNVEHHVFT